VVIDGVRVGYTLERSQSGAVNHRIRIATGTAAITGKVNWRRVPGDDVWQSVDMSFTDGALSAELPVQPPAGKLAYRVTLRGGDETAELPADGPAVLRYKGVVPLWVLIPHIVAMFAAMLLSSRTGMEIFIPSARLKALVLWTTAVLFVGGMILGPIVQKYAFDAYWTGWPFGTDLTDNKTFVALIAWIVAAFAVHISRRPERWTLGAAVVLIVVYLIPHSLLGSELDDRTHRIDGGEVTTPAAR
jgi:hypothetical protein